VFTSCQTKSYLAQHRRSVWLWVTHVRVECASRRVRTVGVTPVSFSAEVTVIHEEKSSTGVFDSYAITANQVSVSVSAGADHDFVQDDFRSTPVGQQWTVH
jgi:hypothetical protein